MKHFTGTGVEIMINYPHRMVKVAKIVSTFHGKNQPFEFYKIVDKQAKASAVYRTVAT